MAARMQTLSRQRFLLALAFCLLPGCSALNAGSGEAPAAALNTSPAIQASIPIASYGPIFLAMAGDGSRVFAAGDNGFTFVDTASHQISGSLSTPPHPAGLTASAATGRVYLTNLFAGRMTVVDGRSQSLLSPINLPVGPTAPAFGRIATSPNGATAFVLDEGGQQLLVTDTAQGTIDTMQLGMRPADIAISADGTRGLICGCHGFCTPGFVQSFDPVRQQFGGSVQVGPSPYRIVFHPSGRWAYTANLGDGTVSVIDTVGLSVLANIPVAAQLTDLAISADAKWVYAISRATNQLGVIDAVTNQLRGKITVGPTPREIVLSPDGATAYVSTATGVVVIDTVELRAQLGGN